MIASRLKSVAEMSACEKATRGRVPKSVLSSLINTHSNHTGAGVPSRPFPPLLHICLAQRAILGDSLAEFECLQPHSSLLNSRLGTVFLVHGWSPKAVLKERNPIMYCGREASCAVLYLRLAKVRNIEAEWEKDYVLYFSPFCVSS